MTRRKHEQIWVDPSFAAALRAQARIQEMSLINLTRQMGKELNEEKEKR